MVPTVLSLGRLAAIGTLGAAPVALVLVLLAQAGHLTAGQAMATILVIGAACGAFVVLLYRETARLTAFAERLGSADPAPGPLPDLTTKPARLLAENLVRLQQDWRDQSEALAGQLETALATIEALHDPLLVLDTRRIVTRANGAAVDLLGHRLVGRDLAERLRHPDVLSAVNAVLQGEGSRSIEYTQPVPIEQVFEVRVKPFERLPATTGADIGPDIDWAAAPAALITFHDITAIKRSEQMRADFVANASHELRTPLSTLSGFIETLRGPARDDPDARDRFLAIMQEQAGRMSRLINDLLSLSRIELDEHTPPTADVDLIPVLRAVIATLEIKAQKRHLKLRLTAPDGLPGVIGDDDQLSQVFQNLIDNAIKYTRPDTEIVVTARVVGAGPRSRGRWVAVSVQDRGEGIDKAHIPRLTERFYRVDPARSRAMGGTGLGLAIVKHIVSRHRGKLTIESDVGAGSIFTVTLPVVGVTRPSGTTHRRDTAEEQLEPS